MICPNCNKPASRIIINRHGKACASCRGLSQNGGAKLDGILTRNSDRIRTQQQQHEGDLILPHSFDKLTGKVVPNPDFVNKYPDKLPTYFTQKELEKAGYSKAEKIFKADVAAKKAVQAEAASVEFAKDPGGAKLKEMVENA